MQQFHLTLEHCSTNIFINRLYMIYTVLHGYTVLICFYTDLVCCKLINYTLLYLLLYCKHIWHISTNTYLQVTLSRIDNFLSTIKFYMFYTGDSLLYLYICILQTHFTNTNMYFYLVLFQRFVQETCEVQDYTSFI